MKKFGIPILALALLGLMVDFGPATFAQASPTAPLSTKPLPLPPLAHPPGDIPDTQVFVGHRSPLGFFLKVPEGWSRRQTATGVDFSNAYNSISVEITHVASAPTLASAKAQQVPALQALPIAVRITKVMAVELPAGKAILIAFSSNSAPNAVTGKAIRLENDQYLLWKSGRLATLTLSAPYGADNADQWNLIARSFQW